MYAAADLTWREYVMPDGETVLAKRCICRAAFAETVVISVHRSEMTVDIYPHQAEKVCNVLTQNPRRTFKDSEITPANIYLYVGQDDTERVIGEVECAPFIDVYPAWQFMDGILEKWRTIRFPGWLYSTMCSRNFCFLKDFDAFNDSQTHTCAVSDQGISIYYSNIKDGCTLSSDERLLFLDSNVITPNAIAELSCWPNAYELVGVQRALRRWLFYEVVARAV